MSSSPWIKLKVIPHICHCLLHRYYVDVIWQLMQSVKLLLQENRLFSDPRLHVWEPHFAILINLLHTWVQTLPAIPITPRWSKQPGRNRQHVAANIEDWRTNVYVNKSARLKATNHDAASCNHMDAASVKQTCGDAREFTVFARAWRCGHLVFVQTHACMNKTCS